MVKRGLMILLGASLASALSCGKSFQGNGGGGATPSQSCTSTADCTIPNDPCTTVSCQNSKCLYLNRQDNVDLPQENQVQGDCKTIVCIQGTSTTKNDSGDRPDDGPCKTFACVNGEVVPENKEVDTPCGEGGMLKCDADGNCGGCTETPQCGTPPACVEFFCNDSGICEENELTNVDLDDSSPGNCLRPRCNENGDLVNVADDTDLPEDQTPGDCLAPLCIQGDVEMEPVGDGTSCTAPEAGTCCADVCCAGACEEGTCNAGQGGQGGMAGMGGAGGAGQGGN